MLFFEARKFVYIAVPKTGTTSVEQEMQRIDPDILRNHVVLPSGEVRRVNKHIALAEVQALLGDKASEYKYFGFVREPVDHVISRYYYYARGRARQNFETRAISKRRLPMRAAKVWFARFVPRPLWFILYPLRQQTFFLRDQRGRIAVDFCGRMDRLKSDLEAMLRRAGYASSEHQLDRLNVAPRDEIGQFEQRLIAAVVKWRLRDDIAFYKHLGEHHDVS